MKSPESINILDSFSHLVTCFFFLFFPFLKWPKKIRRMHLAWDVLYRQTAFDLRLWDLVEDIFGNLWQWFWCYFQRVLGTTSIWGLVSKAFQNWWVIICLTILWQDNLCLCFNFLKGLSRAKEPVWHLGMLTGNWAMKKTPGCLGYIGDEILPSFIGTMINRYKL